MSTSNEITAADKATVAKRCAEGPVGNGRKQQEAPKTLKPLPWDAGNVRSFVC